MLLLGKCKLPVTNMRLRRIKAPISHHQSSMKKRETATFMLELKEQTRGVLALVMLALSGCVGTDLIQDVDDAIPARIEIMPASAVLQVDSSLVLTATYYDTLGEAHSTPVNWTSLHPDIAAIDSTGRLVGLRRGQTTVTASARGIHSMPAMVTVVANAEQIAAIEVAPEMAEIATWDSVQLTATPVNLDGEAVPGVILSWRSDNPEVASVDSDGLVQALQAGQTNIYAAAEDIESMAIAITVTSGSRQGTFTKRPGTSYNVNGTAIMEMNKGGLGLRFADDFNCSSGPGLHVFLSQHNSVNASSVDLGDLKSTSGAQTYVVPEGISLSSFDWVIIHCVPFNVTFGYAELN